MGRIVELDSLTIDRIAAGEVVDRPASAAKELVENALDAGARRIHVDLVSGGLDLLRIDDDGEGMDPADLRLCWKRHATSKLIRLEDLGRLSTYGFRGEALSSLAAVAGLRLASRTSHGIEGWEIEIRHGRILSEGPCSRPTGTRVEVEGLFAGLPVRRRFLGSPSMEAGKVLQTVLRLALSRPDVGFRLRHGDRPLLECVPETRPRRVRGLLGALAEGVVEVARVQGDLAVSGLVGGPGTDRGRPDQVFVSINRRPVTAPALARAAAQGAGVPRGRWPVAILDLVVPAELVDVNVHPQKREVRLRNEAALFHLVRDAVADALSCQGPLPRLDNALLETFPASDDLAPWLAVAEEPRSHLDAAPPPIESAMQGDLFSSTDNRLLAFPRSRAHEHPTPRADVLDKGTIPILQIDGLLVCALQGGLLVVDLHRAHLKVLFEHALASLEREGRMPSQQLLLPRAMELPPALAHAAAVHASLLADLSFDLEPFGDDTVLLRGVPSGVDPDRAEGALLEVLTGLVAEESAESTLRVQAALGFAESAAASEGQILTPEERQRLIEDLFCCRDPWTDPRGRPTVARLGAQELERLFR